YGAISQIKPDEAFVVTTEGYTRGARSFAEEEKIKLAILRVFSEEDWDGRIRKIHIKSSFKSIKERPQISWVAASQKEIDNFHANANKNEVNSVQDTNTVETFFYDKHGEPQENLQSVLQPIFINLPRDIDSPTTGYHEFESTKYVKIAGALLGIKGFKYEFTSEKIVLEDIIDSGEKIAILLFKVIDGTLDKVIFDQDLDNWTFNEDGEVISRDDN
ncbi:hypothetical protein, partial [Priestia megaterium]